MDLSQYYKDGLAVDDSPKFKKTKSDINDLINKMQDKGLRVDFLKKGELVRVPVVAANGVRPDKSNERSGWYIYHEINSEFSCCVYGNWRTSEEHKWYSTTLTKLSNSEQKELTNKLKEIKEKAKEDKIRKQNETAEYVKDKYSKADQITAHPYLKAKQIGSYGIKEANGNLLVPMYRLHPETKELDLRSVQYIMPDGQKRFASAGETKGNFLLIGADLASIDQIEKIAVVEGYATGCSLWESCNVPVLVVFSALFCADALTQFRKIYSGQFILALDNDKNGVGQNKAKEVQSTIFNCIARLPSEEGDYNDLMLAYGPQKVQNDFWAKGFNIQAFSIKNCTGEPPERKFLVDNLIQKDVAGIFSGVGGIGKSGLLLSLALKVAAGKGRWMGHPITDSGDVVFLTAEDDQSEIHRRLQSIDPDEKRLGYKNNVYVYCMPDVGKPLNLIAEDKNGINLTDSAWELQEELVSFSPSLLIIDPLSSFCTAPVSSSNEVGQLWGNYVSGLAKKMGAAVITSHHMSKQAFNATDNFGYRSAIRGASSLVDSARWAAILHHVKQDLVDEICINEGVEPDENRVAQFSIVKSNGQCDFSPKILFRKNAILEPVDNNNYIKQW